MSASFMLRFQENCLIDAPIPACGTATQTRQLSEGSDRDPHAAGYSTLPRVPVATTQAGTAVRGEWDDRDPTT